MASQTQAQVMRRNSNRSRDAYSRSVAVLRAFRDIATPEEAERVAVRLESALASTEISPQRVAFLEAITGGRSVSPKERIELEVESIAGYFQKRRELIEGSLTAPQVARILGTTRQTPHDRVRAGTLLAVRDRGVLRFPSWQFDPDGSEGVIIGLPQVLRTLTVSPLAKVSWFVRANPFLQGQTPVEGLVAGELERVLSIARGVGVN